MDFLELAKRRRAIRRYQNRQVDIADVDYVVEAGLYAPSAGGGQRSMICVLRGRELCERVGRLNMAGFDPGHVRAALVSREQPSVIDDPTLKSGFYGAPTVCAIFGERGFAYRTADAYCCAENMVLAATQRGLASNIVARGEETFASGEGQELLREWGVPADYEAVCFVLLGHIDGDWPQSKPRNRDRVKVVGEDE